MPVNPTKIDLTSAPALRLAPVDFAQGGQSAELALAERLRRRYLGWARFFFCLVIAGMAVQMVARFAAGRGDPEFWMNLACGSGLVTLALLPFFVPTLWLGIHYAKRAAHLRNAHGH